MTYDDWIKELKAEEKAHEDWRKRAQKVVDRYEDEEDRDDSKFNILWSNTEVLHSALYAKSPTPDIRRRFLDRDPAGKKASELAERAVSYCIDTYDFDGTADACIDDYLLAGMGVPRLRYTPYFETGEAPKIPLELRANGMDDQYNTVMSYFLGEDEVSEYEQDEYGAYILGEPEEELVYEEVTTEPVNWNRFRWQPSARWEDVDWACIEHYMTKEEVEENYGKEASEQIPLGYTDKGEKATNEDEKARALIHEIFDKKARKNIEIAEGYNEILKEEDDPLELEGFYPFPKPLVTTLKNGKFIPIPDYLFYQDQAIELDTITNRINKLSDQLKYRGVYDSSFDALQNVAKNDDGDFTPIDDFQTRFEGKGDIDKVIASMPIEEVQRVLLGLYNAREEIKQTIYEITGIADIMRGSTKSSETLGAQQLKTQFGSMRLAKRQRKVAQFIRDIVRLKVEIMVEQFSPETLQIMTGMELTEDVYHILTNDLMRSYRIDIETDSTITEDAAEEKSQRIELVTAVTGFVEKVAPQVQAGLMPANVAKELLGFAVRGFKIGRTLEDTLDEMGGDDQDPRMQEMQGKMQQQVQQIQQQAGAYVQQIQEQASKKIDQAEQKLFEAQKKLAINAESSQVRIQEAQIKGEIMSRTQSDKNEMAAQLEVFKAQLQAIQQMPEDRSSEVKALIDSITEEFSAQQQANQDTFQVLEGQIQETRQGLSDVSEYMKRPARVIRDDKGRVIGATRD